jgi:hypothetical protein
MGTYTVIVEYPSRLRTYQLDGSPMYVAIVEAEGVSAAIKAGKLQAMRAQANEDRGSLSDWRVLLVFRDKLTPVFHA